MSEHSVVKNIRTAHTNKLEEATSEKLVKRYIQVLF